MAEAGFKQQQYAFTAHIRNPRAVPCPSGVEDRRMKIYRELLYNNVEGFVSSGFPVLRSMYDDEAWHRMVRDFFANHQSKTPYFLEISQEFLRYLQNERAPQPEDPPGALELAHYEWVELALHVAEDENDMRGIDPNGDLMAGHPVLSVLAWPLVYQYPVHEMGPERHFDAPPEQPTCLVVYRNRKDEVKFLLINPVTARLLELLQENPGFSGHQAIEKIIEELNHPNPDIVFQGGQQALDELQQLGIILGTRKKSAVGSGQ